MSNLETTAREALALADKVTKSNIIVGWCEPDKDKLVKAFTQNIDESIKYNPDNKYWFINTEEDFVVAHFGNGPTSENNAEFWATSRTMLPALAQGYLDLLADIKEINDREYDIVTPYKNRIKQLEKQLMQMGDAYQLAVAVKDPSPIVIPNGHLIEKLQSDRAKLVEALKKANAVDFRWYLRGLDKPTDFAESFAKGQALAEIKTIIRAVLAEVENGKKKEV